MLKGLNWTKYNLTLNIYLYFDTFFYYKIHIHWLNFDLKNNMTVAYCFLNKNLAN